MKKFSHAITVLLTGATLFFGTLSAEDKEGALGIVNFKKCVENSKLGKVEKQSFEETKNKMTEMMEGMKKELEETAKKFQDPDFLDSLSPEKEEEMKKNFSLMNQDIARYENQYYYTLNQANMQFIQTLSSSVNKAAELVGERHGLSLIVDSETCFFFASKIDVTEEILVEMDKTFDLQQAENAEKKDS